MNFIRKKKKDTPEREYTPYERKTIATGWFVIKVCFAVGTMVSVWIILLKN